MRLGVLGRTAVAAAVGGLAMVTIVAGRMTPPASAIADRYSTLAAILVAATVIATLVASRGRLGRPGRLAAVVVLLAARSSSLETSAGSCGRAPMRRRRPRSLRRGSTTR